MWAVHETPTGSVCSNHHRVKFAGMSAMIRVPMGRRRSRATMTTIFFAAFVAAILCSCATVPMASASADASAKRFQVPLNKSRVYLVRASGFAPGVVFSVSVDGRKVGLLPARTYLLVEVEPGDHSFIAAGHENEDSVALTVESGKAYFLRVGPRPGWLFARAAIYEIPEAEGRQVVLHASLAKGFYPVGD